MSFSSEVVSIEIKDKVGTLWLDRPEKYNALSEQVWLDIPKALNELVKLDCRVIILAGKGKHFCVGIDLVQGGLSNHLSHASESDATANLKQLEGTKAFQDSISSLANAVAVGSVAFRVAGSRARAPRVGGAAGKALDRAPLVTRPITVALSATKYWPASGVVGSISSRR